jgi:hypothetical protein
MSSTLMQRPALEASTIETRLQAGLRRLSRTANEIASQSVQSLSVSLARMSLPRCSYCGKIRTTGRPPVSSDCRATRRSNCEAEDVGLCFDVVRHERRSPLRRQPTSDGDRTRVTSSASSSARIALESQRTPRVTRRGSRVCGGWTGVPARPSRSDSSTNL